MLNKAFSGKNTTLSFDSTFQSHAQSPKPTGRWSVSANIFWLWRLQTQLSPQNSSQNYLPGQSHFQLICNPKHFWSHNSISMKLVRRHCKGIFTSQWWLWRCPCGTTKRPEDIFQLSSTENSKFTEQYLSVFIYKHTKKGKNCFHCFTGGET